MGGYGTAYLGTKYHRLFAGIRTTSAAFEYNPENLTTVRDASWWKRFGSDMSFARSHSPWFVPADSAAAIRTGGLKVQVVEGSNDGFYSVNLRWQKMLDSLGIDAEFIECAGAGHDDTYKFFPGDEVDFYRKLFRSSTAARPRWERAHTLAPIPSAASDRFAPAFLPDGRAVRAGKAHIVVLDAGHARSQSLNFRKAIIP
jgi:hypothetical protein